MKIRIQIMAMIALLIVLSLVKATDENPFLHLKNDIKANESFDDFIKKYAYGNLNFESNEGSHFYSYNNMILLLKIIEKDFKEVSRVSTIGKSYKGRDMPLVTFGLNIVRNEEQKGEHNPPSMMLTSVHHAREVVGVSMNVYTMLYLLHSFEHNDLGVKSILRMHNIYFIPFVNVDSYHEIFEKFEQTNIYSQIRKNRHYENN